VQLLKFFAQENFSQRGKLIFLSSENLKCGNYYSATEEQHWKNKTGTSFLHLLKFVAINKGSTSKQHGARKKYNNS